MSIHKTLSTCDNLIFYCSIQPQKKKKDRRKGKGGDVDEDEEDDVMLKLTKLSVQASDEDDEAGMIFQDTSLQLKTL